MTYDGCFQFEPDFRTPFIGCGPTMNTFSNLIKFLDPNFFFQSTIVTMHIFCLPTILTFFSDKHNFQSTLFELWNTMHIF